MCVPQLASGVGKAASFMVSPVASIIGALGKKKSSTPAPSTSTSATGSGY